MSPERWRFGVGVRGCAIPDEEKSRRAIKAKPRKILTIRGVRFANLRLGVWVAGVN